MTGCIGSTTSLGCFLPRTVRRKVFSAVACSHGDGEAIFLYHGTKAGNSIATASDYWLDNVGKSPANPIVPVQDDLANKQGSQGWAPGTRMAGEQKTALTTVSLAD